MGNKVNPYLRLFGVPFRNVSPSQEAVSSAVLGGGAAQDREGAWNAPFSPNQLEPTCAWSHASAVRFFPLNVLTLLLKILVI